MSCGPTCGSGTSTTSRSRRWRSSRSSRGARQVVEGLLGADLIGFQRGGDAANFVRVVRRLTDLTTRGQIITVDERTAACSGTCARRRSRSRSTRARSTQLARTDEVQRAPRRSATSSATPRHLLLGVDRLDYTKGIRHRIKAYGELLEDGRLSPSDTTLVQVASPSRENVGAYQQLRDDVELLVGRINGDYGQVGHAPVQYLHQSYPMEEMAALYLAADVMLVTALRDGMNLVAKEYVAARSDDRGALVLSEFTGAADELTGCDPGQPARHRRHEGRHHRTPRTSTRVRPASACAACAAACSAHDVDAWSQRVPRGAHRSAAPGHPCLSRRRPAHRPRTTPRRRRARSAARSSVWRSDEAARPLLVALDFDGTLAPLRDDPAASRILPEGVAPLRTLADGAGRRPLALVSGRALHDLHELAEVPVGTYLIGSHGAERARVTRHGLDRDVVQLTDEQADRLAALGARASQIARGRDGVWVETKPTAVVVHTRLAEPDDAQRRAGRGPRARRPSSARDAARQGRRRDLGAAREQGRGAGCAARRARCVRRRSTRATT